MPLRLLLGLVQGLVIGGLLAFGAERGLGLHGFGPGMAFTSAAVAGASIALVAGRPVWATGAKLEAALKALFAAAIALGGTYALRRWVAMPLALGPLGHGSITELPRALLPLVSTALALFFQVDHGAGGSEPAAAPPRKRVAARADTEVALEDEAEHLEPSARRRSR